MTSLGESGFSVVMSLSENDFWIGISHSDVSVLRYTLSIYVYDYVYVYVYASNKI